MITLCSDLYNVQLSDDMKRLEAELNELKSANEKLEARNTDTLNEFDKIKVEYELVKAGTGASKAFH